MKISRAILPFAFSTYCQVVRAGTNDPAPDLLAYNLRTTVDAYDRAGRKDPKWDVEAKACLRKFAELRSLTNGAPTSLPEQLKTDVAKVMGLKCDDPLLRYLHTRFVLSASRSTAELLPVYTEVASALEQSAY